MEYQQNVSCYDQSMFSKDVYLPIIVFLFGFITVIGNSFTILAYIKRERIRQLTLNTYICNLSISDLGMGFISFGWFFIWLVLGQPALNIWIFLAWNFFFHMFLYVSVSSLILITYDRYIMVSNPLSYRLKQRKKQARVKLVIVWIICIVFALVGQVLVFFFSKERYSVCPEKWPSIRVRQKVFALMMLFFDFVVPFDIMFVLNIMVLYKILIRTRRQLQQCITELGITDTTLNKQLWFDCKSRFIQKCACLRKTIASNTGKQQRNIADFSQFEEKPAVSLVGFKGTMCSQTGVIWDQPERFSFRQSNIPPAENTIQVRKMADAANDERTSTKRQGLILLQKRVSMERKRMIKATKNVLIFVQLFHCSWMPYYIVTTVSYFVPYSMTIFRAQYITLFLLCCNSTINPFIYTVMSKAYREFLWRYVFRRK